MEKTATLNLRVNPEVKRDAETVLEQLGIPMFTAITMYLKQIVLTGGIPFAPRLPSSPRSLDATRTSTGELESLLKSRTACAETDEGLSLEEARAQITGQRPKETRATQVQLK